MLGDSANHCSDGNLSNAANPCPRYLHWGAGLTNVFDCSCYDPGWRGDRELPVIVVPGITPAGVYTADACVNFLGSSSNIIACLGNGTSISAPTANGIAACVISADSRMVGWPEIVKLVLLATAHNVDDREWTDYFQWWNRWDGRDGAGVISGADAVWFARNHQTITENNAAVENGISTGYLTTADEGTQKQYNILVPNPMPSGKHLRVVLTWSSSPCEIAPVANDLSDLDLYMTGDVNGYYCTSWDDNVEMIDVTNSDLTAGSSYYVVMEVGAMRISACAYADWIKYAIGWTWVKDHAD